MTSAARSGSVVAALAFAASVTLLRGQQPNLGYDDTPMQPDGKWRVHDSRRPRPPIVTAGPIASVAPPSDAVILLRSGNDLSNWQASDGSAASWRMSDGVLQTGKGLIQTKAAFTDIQLHVEFSTPSEVKGSSQDRGNSGVFLAGVFEIQVLDSFDNPTYADGQAAAMYGQYPPLVNASRRPGEWQSYDIAFTAPRFNGADLVAPAVVTVVHNGVLVHNARAFWGPTAHRRIDPYIPSTARGPIRLQDHGNPVRYRNIWLRELVVPSLAASPTGFAMWKSAELMQRDEALSKKVGPDHSARETLADYGDHRFRMLYRDADGVPEQHDNIVDVVIVRSGQGTLLLGGKMINPRASTGRGEYLGTGIEGGERHALAPGDLVHIPAKVPHAFLVPKGEHITYVLVKSPAPE